MCQLLSYSAQRQKFFWPGNTKSHSGQRQSGVKSYKSNFVHFVRQIFHIILSWVFSVNNEYRTFETGYTRREIFNIFCKSKQGCKSFPLIFAIVLFTNRGTGVLGRLGPGQWTLQSPQSKTYCVEGGSSPAGSCCRCAGWAETNIPRSTLHSYLILY